MKKLVLLFCLSGLAFWLGFFATTPEEGLELFKRFAYLPLLITFGLWIALVVRSLMIPKPELPWREIAGVAGLILAILLFYRWAEPVGYNVLNDEAGFAAAAVQIHLHREFGLPLISEIVDGELVIAASGLSKRPYVYPFIVSLLHDLTGFRPANAWFANQLLTAAIFALVYLIGRRLAGWAGGLSALLFWAALPLTAHSAVGSGLDAANTLFLAATLWLGMRYVEAPTATARAGAVAVTGVLLAQSRTEAGVFVLLTGALLLFGWIRARQWILPWSLLLCPMLMVPTALHVRIFQTNRDYFEFLEEQQSPFGLRYLFGDGETMGNLAHAASFFFNTNPDLAMVWPVTALGLAGWVIALAGLGWRRRSWSDDIRVVGLFVFGALLHLVLILCYFWGQIDDPLAARFAFPALMALMLGPPLALSLFSNAGPLRTALLAAAAGVCLFCAFPTMAMQNYGSSQDLASEKQWLRDVSSDLDPDDVFVFDTNVLPWIAEGFATAPLDVSDELPEVVKNLRGLDFYFVERVLRNPETGDKQSEADIPKHWRRKEIVGIGMFAPNVLIRVIRVEPGPKQ